LEEIVKYKIYKSDELDLIYKRMVRKHPLLNEEKLDKIWKEMLNELNS